MTETITPIPLNKLIAWEGNVRKTEVDKGIHELATSIASHGLLQSLVVRKAKRGKYAVVAGQRRLLALQSLAQNGSIEETRLIPCTTIEAEVDAEEISLAENVQREAMHPADEFDAFKALTDKGTPPADIAARFGVTEAVVQKRLKLAKVSPKLIAAYRGGEMTLQLLMAFTITDDHAAQERLWTELEDWQLDSPDFIRETLTVDEINAGNPRVQFVGLDEYERAGGRVRRDLFSEGDDGVFLEDAILLESLVAAKLETTAERLRQTGWKWVEIRPTFDHEEWSKYGRVHAERPSLSPDEEAELARLQTEHESLWEIEEPTEEQEDRITELSGLMFKLEEREPVWSPEALASAGAIVTLRCDGQVAIREGYLRPEDRPKSDSGNSNKVPAQEPIARDLPSSLIESLTAHRSAAINAELMRRPVIALAALVAALATQIFAHGRREDNVLQISAFVDFLHRVEGSDGHKVIVAEHDQLGATLPSPQELFSWCLQQPQDDLLRLLAYCVAQTVDAVKTKVFISHGKIDNINLLASALGLDMTKWFTPTAENYFSRVSKAQILDDLREAKGTIAPAWTHMKKADLAALAERQIAGTGWLPELLRAAPEPPK